MVSPTVAEPLLPAVPESVGLRQVGINDLSGFAPRLESAVGQRQRRLGRESLDGGEIFVGIGDNLVGRFGPQAPELRTERAAIDRHRLAGDLRPLPGSRLPVAESEFGTTETLGVQPGRMRPGIDVRPTHLDVGVFDRKPPYFGAAVADDLDTAGRRKVVQPIEVILRELGTSAHDMVVMPSGPSLSDSTSTDEWSRKPT